MVARVLSPGSEIDLEFPSGTVPLNSPFYIERPPLETLARAEIEKPGCVLRLQGAPKMGKSSLALRLVACAIARGYRTARLDFQQLEPTLDPSLDKFLRWLCANVSRQLHLKPALQDYWDEDLGSKASCTLYWQDYLLERLDGSLVLVLEEVQQLFKNPNLCSEVFSLLRSWQEESVQQVGSWQKLRLVIACTIDHSVSNDQTLCNIGLPLSLPRFNFEQARDLALRHGLDWADGTAGTALLEPLYELVGGHPYLIRLAFYHLCRQEVTLEQLLQEAPTCAGIYQTYLRGYLGVLRREPNLAAAMKWVVSAPEAVELDAIATHQLESMGLANINGDRVEPSCPLYRQYFRVQLDREENLIARLQRLERENQELRGLIDLDKVTRLPDRDYFNQYLQQEWQRLEGEQKSLSAILGHIDYFHLYKEGFGDRAGDECLQQVADALRVSLRRPADSLFHYDGPTFVALLPDTDAGGALHLAERIQRTVLAKAI
ncbi:MAG: AAA-like domain-containing protein, partial [Cyanobacteriota bacterium]|nr:AAA-like domain-containing protein [Cyanobacteriota bacterium]